METKKRGQSDIIKSKKKGLSDIVSTVIIILIIVAAVAIIGTIVLRNVGKSGTVVEQGTASKLLLSIPAQSILVNTSTSTVVLNVQRSGDKGDIVGYYIILEDASGKSMTIRINSTINQLEVIKSNQINYTGFLSGPPVAASVAAILKDSSGKEIAVQSYKKTAVSSPNVVGVQPPATPNAPTDVLQVPNNIQIDWNDVATATNYNVQRSTDGGVNWSASIASPAASTYTDANLAGGTYVHRVNACNSGGCSAYSSQSNSVPIQSPA